MAKTKKTTKARQASTARNTSTAKEKSALGTTAGTAAAEDRRARQDRRTISDRRKTSEPVVVERRKIERRTKVNRRRQIDPTTCERDYTPDEIEFMSALDDYRRVSGRMFPTCSEVLEVIKRLGYQKRPKTKADQPLSGVSAAQGPGTTAV